MLRRLPIIIFSLWAIPAIPQTTGQQKTVHYGYLQMLYHQGTTWSRTEYLSEQFNSGFRGIEMRLGFQSTGNKEWQLFHHYPRYGIGINYSDLVIDSRDTIVGNPFSGFGFFSFPWVRLGRITLYSDLSVGLSYTSLYHDPVRNPYNDVVASRINLYFNFNLNLNLILSNRIDVNAGYGLVHYSNGAIQSPQKGVNNWGFNLGMNYFFKYPNRGSERSSEKGARDVRPDLAYIEIPDTLPRSAVQIMASVGIVDNQKLGELEGIHYFTSSVTTDYAVPVSIKNYITLGVDFLYDGSLEKAIKGTPPEDVTTFQKTYLGSHMGYQVLIDRITLLFNFGTYFIQHSMDRGFWFMRAGGRIRLTDQMHAHVCIKTKGGIRADWIEWGVAYYVNTN